MMSLTETLWLPIVLLIGAAVFWSVCRSIGWAHLKIVERVIDAVLLAVLVAVAIRYDSAFIRIVAAVSASLLLIAWSVAWRRRSTSSTTKGGE